MTSSGPRVAFIIDNYRPTAESGYGGSRYLAGVLRRLEARGGSWHIFTRQTAADERVSQVGPRYSKQGYGSRLTFSRQLWARREEFERFDVVHSLSASSIPFLHALRRRGTPTLYDCRTAFIRARRALAAFHLATLAAFPPSRVAFVDHTSLRDYRRLLRRDAAYFPVGIEISGPPREPADDVETVLFATQLSPLKGFPEVLRACATLWRQGATFTLEVAGAGALAGELQAFERGWPGRVRGLGLLDEAGMRAALDRAGLVLNPSRAEGVSRLVLEALGHGVPVIATAVGGMRQLTERDLVQVVRPGDPRGLAEATAQLCANPQRRADLSVRGADFVRSEHTWEAALEALFTAYQQLGVRMPVAA